MKKFEMLLEILISGALAALIIGGLIWVCSAFGLFQAVGIPINAANEGVEWFVERGLRGALWALLFLIPVMTDRPHPTRGMIFGLAPALEIMVLQYTILEGRGLLGIDTSIWLPVLAIAIWVIWGWVTGKILAVFGFKAWG